jgi:Uma2 family endonuclease
MPRLFMPKDHFERILRRRRKCGGDRYDEVWNGVYVMSPLADNEHQEVASNLAGIFKQAVSGRGRVFAGANVSDRPERWKKNFRCPDVAVFLPGNPAEDRGTFWFGGPDFAVEIISKEDRSREKLDFYAKVGVKELLLIDRKPWRLELYRLDNGVLSPVGTVEPAAVGAVLESAVLPVSFRLTQSAPRPEIVICQTIDGRTWTV